MQLPRIPIWTAGYWPNRKPFRRAAHFDGVYISSQQATGEALTPSALQEALAYIHTQRDLASPFDVAFAGGTPADCDEGAKTVQPYREARVTWWLEGIWTERGAVEKMRERIRQGPPRGR